MSNLLTESELCEVLQVGRVFLYYCRQNGMPYIQLGKKLVRYDLGKVIEYFDSLVIDGKEVV